MHPQAHDPTTASAAACATGTVFYILILAALTLALPLWHEDDAVGGLLLTLGAVGFWRHGWWALHLVRASIYTRRRFPRLRAAADALGRASRAPHVFVVITTYRIEREVSLPVYTALVRNAIAYGAPVTIVAAVTDEADEALIADVWRMLRPPAHIDLIVQFQDGTGKRTAIARALGAVARRRPPAGSLVVLMDGDVLLPAHTLNRSLAFFAVRSDLGALTVDNRGITSGPAWAREWYDLRFAQRHLLMRSMAVSDRLLVLTGRFSAFRAFLATDPEFIRTVEADYIEHWRFGRLPLLSGDDKSTWFWLLQRRQPMLYVPDVQVHSFEKLPAASFIRGSTQLMMRWFGNTLRTSTRAIALGPRHLGFFTWWTLVDQRLSMWTTLIGPVAALCFAINYTLQALMGYAAWVLLTRLIGSGIVAMQRRRFSPFFPFLMYYSQIGGSLIKIYVSFRLNRQKWTRQGIAAREGMSTRSILIQRAVSAALHGLATIAFVAGVAVTVGALPPPDRVLRSVFLVRAAEARDRADDAGWLQQVLDQAAPGSQVQLPAGTFRLSRPLRITRDAIVLAGEGPGRTVLVAGFAASEGEAVLLIQGETPPDVPRARCALLARAATPEDADVQLDRPIELGPSRHLSIRVQNDDAYLRAIASQVWREEYPFVRQSLVEVAEQRGERIALAQPLGFDFPAGTEACPISLRRGVTLRGFSIVYHIGREPDPARYVNAQPGHAVDGISISGAAEVVIEHVEVLNAGRHPLNLDTVLAPRVRWFRAIGAHNKGEGGNGYFRVARTYHGAFAHIELRGLRHLAVQWSSHDNIITGLDSDTDVNFHGGYAHHNVIQADRLAPRSGHPWPAVFRTPPNAGWAPPDGPGNRVIDAAGRPL